MNAVIRTLMIAAAVGLVLIVLMCASDDSEALNCVENKINFNPDELLVYYGGNPVEPLTVIEEGYSIYVTEKTGYHNVTLNGEPYTQDIFGHVILASERDSGILLQADKIQYSVSYETTEEVNGTFPSNSTVFTINSTVPISSSSFSRTGYAFNGWNTSVDGSGDDFQPGSYLADADFITEHYSSSTSITLYPQWTIVEYTIEFDYNSGTGQLPNDITEKTIGSQITIPSVGLFRTGYTVSVWNTSSNGDGFDISPGTLALNVSFIESRYGNNTLIILYPKWVEIQYTISFESTETITGQLPEQMGDITIGTQISIPSAALSRTGFTLDGWNTSPDGLGDSFSPGNYNFVVGFITDFYGQDTDLVLYPKWVPKEYSISFNSNSGTGQQPNGITGKTIGSEISIPDISLTRTGYAVSVWNTSPNGSGQDVNPGQLSLNASFITGYYGNSTSITLYPKWTEIHYTISFVSTETITGDLPEPISDITIGAEISILSAELSRIGYLLDEWNTSPNGSGEDYHSGDYTVDADFITGHFAQGTSIVLYPKWIAKEYSISFNSNSGTGQQPNGISGKTIGTQVMIPSMSLSRTGYTVSVWNTSSNGSGQDVNPGQLSLNASFITNYYGDSTSLTLYPKWVEVSYSVLFDSTEEMKGALPNSVSGITIGSNVSIQSASLSRTGYTLSGWNTSSDGTGADFQPGNYTADADFITGHYSQGTSFTLYPKWVPKEYSISFNHNLGSGQPPGTISNITIVTGADIPAVGLSRTGYAVSVWNTSPDGKGLDVNPGHMSVNGAFIESNYGSSSDITLYPKWVKNTYSINFDTAEDITGTMPSSLINFTIDSTVTIPSATFSRSGYGVGSWNTSSDGSGRSIEFGDLEVDSELIGDIFGNGNVISLYPTWSLSTYTIKLTTERGKEIDWTVKDGSYIRTYSVESPEITLPIMEPDDRFHSFVGWRDSGGNPVSSIISGSVGDVELSAVWVERSYPITATINGRIVTFDLTLSSEMPEAEPEDGFEFKGWYYIDENGDETRFESMDQMTEGMSIYAVFEPIKDDPMMIIVSVSALVLFFVAVMGYGFTRK